MLVILLLLRTAPDDALRQVAGLKMRDNVAATRSASTVSSTLAAWTFGLNDDVLVTMVGTPTLMMMICLMLSLGFASLGHT
jgi:hypothetical protein